MSNLIVSVSGLRGIVDETFTPDVIIPYVVAYADMLEKKTVVVGGDSRPSREWAQPVVESALRARGIDVISIGLAPTPTIGLTVRRLRAGGGIAITASHNPSEWNGLKFFSKRGQFLNTDEFAKLNDLLKKPASMKGPLPVGARKPRTDALQMHLKKVRKELLGAEDAENNRRKKMRVVLDCCNGAGSILMPLVASSFGVTPEVIYANPGRNFPHNPEPTSAHIKALCREVKRCKADFGVAFDPDADRVALVDETGTSIGEERTLVLAADAYLSMQEKIKPIVVNLSTSQAIEHVAAKYGTKVVRTPIGEAHVLEGIRRKRSSLGGEGNGGVIIPSIHPGRDGATALALIIMGLQSRRGSLSKWNAEFPDYKMLKAKVPIQGLSVKRIIKRARSLFKDGIGVDERDGFKVLYEDSWLHLRPSNTEPILRVFVEAPDSGTAKELLTRVKAILT